MYANLWFENPKGRDNFREMSINGKIILKQISHTDDK
jgi:hypothetical protein